jgi:hypothetical protein
MLVLVSQSLTDGQLAGVEVLGGIGEATFNGLMRVVDISLASSNLAVVVEELLEVLGTKDVDLGKEKLALDKSCVGIVEDGPDRNQILKLSASLLNNAILTSEDNGHARKVVNLSVTHDQRVNVEPASCQNSGNTGQNTRLVLDQTVEYMALGGSG